MTVDDILLKYRAPGCFVNGAAKRRCNLKLLRNRAFEHNGKIWIPMAVMERDDIEEGDFFSWDYDHKAMNGRDRRT
jgi:hypothetical protein